ncbi:hypothetical protein PMKS-002450 [Pichia membranifaciens]|uniref:PCI domain-containing protein n=1 Tax=Pichia membranifaciens TaxID=4926 RepID=A0A1Q2YHG7_9ASCO|nr:hypothetical protein PMKS-002450 [Pichia membranifaciens]
MLKTLLAKSDSPYILSPAIPELISFLSQTAQASSNLITHKTANDLAQKYQENLKRLFNTYGVESMDQVTQDFIMYHYDGLLSQLSHNTEFLDPAEKSEIYSNVCTIISQRDIALWAITGKLQFIQADIVGSLYSIDPDLLVYHDDHKMKHTRDILAHKWGDPMVVNQWQYVLDKTTSILQNLDLDKSLNRSGISVDIVSTQEVLPALSLRLSESESKAYWEIRWWLLYAMFFTGDYDKVVTNFSEMTTHGRTISKVAGDATHILKQLDNTVINKSSLIRVIVISIVLTQANKPREEFWQNATLVEAFYEDPLIKDFKQNFEAISFPKVMDQLKQLRDEIPWCPQFDDAWESARSLLIQKSIITYLSFVSQVTLDHMSNFFAIDKALITTFITKSIALLDLPLTLNTQTEVVEYATGNSRRQQAQFIENMHRNADEEVLRLKAAKLNSILNANSDEENEYGS